MTIIQAQIYNIQQAIDTLSQQYRHLQTALDTTLMEENPIFPMQLLADYQTAQAHLITQIAQPSTEEEFLFIDQIKAQTADYQSILNRHKDISDAEIQQQIQQLAEQREKIEQKFTQITFIKHLTDLLERLLSSHQHIQSNLKQIDHLAKQLEARKQQINEQQHQLEDENTLQELDKLIEIRKQSLKLVHQIYLLRKTLMEP